MKNLTRILVLFVIIYGCNSRSIDWALLLNEYKEDSMRLNATTFLHKNMTGIISKKAVFVNAESNVVDIDFTQFDDASELFEYLDENEFEYRTEYVRDLEFLSTSFLEEVVNERCKLRNAYPWNRNLPSNLFYEFLLPYKIADEFPSTNSYLRNRYKAVIDSLKVLPNITTHDIYKRLIVDDVSKWFKYTEKGKSFTSSPSLDELLLLKEGECWRHALLYAAVLRNAGIPATVDIVPMWGFWDYSGHSEVVFMDSIGKLNTYEPNRLSGAAKVFRTNYSNHGSWDDSIKPYVKEFDFQIPFLKENRLTDVTAEHRETVDVSYSISDSIKALFGYICVYFNDDWRPIYWGKRQDNQILFNKMGGNTLYRVALPDKASGKITIGFPFIVDSTGTISVLKSNADSLVDLKIRASDHKKLAHTENKKKYILEYWDNGWKKGAEQTMLRERIIVFSSIPSNTLYRIVEDGYSQTVRPFSYANGHIKWW